MSEVGVFENIFAREEMYLCGSGTLTWGEDC